MKFNFIILENFLLQNPQLSDAERVEILKLDADLGHQTPVDASEPDGLTASMVAAVGRHVFDEVEIRSFLENNHISYEDLAAPSVANAASVGWRFDLARYIVRNLNDPILQKVIPETGFPIPDGSHLLTKDDPPPETGTRASHNLDLYLQYIENQLTQDADGIRIKNSLPHGPLDINIVKELKPSDEDLATWSVDPDRVVISFLIRSDPLFWKMIDPLDEDPDLRLRFFRAKRLASQALFEKNASPELAQSESTQIANTISRWLGIFTQEITVPIAEASALSPRTKTDDTWLLPVAKKAEFEKFLGDTKVRSYLASGEAWPPSLMEKLFSFFENKPTEPDDQVLRSTNPPSRVLAEIFAANHYQRDYTLVQANGGEVIILRVLEWATNTNDIVSDNNTSRFVLKTEPMTARDRELVDEAFSVGQISESMMPLIPYLCRRDLVGAMIDQKPWLASAFDSIERKSANEAIARFATETYINEQIFIDGDWKFFLNAEEPNAAFLMALKNSEHPRACLAFLLFLAAQQNPLGKNLRASLPYLFNQIEYNYAPYDKTKEDLYRQIPVDEDGDGITDYWAPEITVNVDMHAAGNAWIVWDEVSMARLTTHLSELPEKDLQEVIQKIQNDPVAERSRIAQRYVRTEIKNGDTPHLAGPPLSADKTEKSDGRLKIEPLLNHLKLASTRDKVMSLDPLKSGFVFLDHVLTLTLTGAEREDLRRGISHSLSRHDVAQTGVSGNSVIGSQLELLPVRLLKKLILNNLTDYPSYLWDALFRKNPQEGLDLWTQSLVQHRQNPQDPSWQDQVMYGYPQALHMMDPRADQLISEYRNELVALRAKENEIKLKLGELSPLAYHAEMSQKEYERFQGQSGNQVDCLAALWQSLSQYRQIYGPVSSSDLEKLFSFLPKVWLDFFKWSVGESLPLQRKKEVLFELCETLTQAVMLLTDTPRVVSDPLPGWSNQSVRPMESISAVFDEVVATVFDLIKDDPHLHGGMPAYTALLEQRFRSYHFSPKLYGPIIDKLEPFAGQGLAQGVYLAGAVRGHEWGWQNLDAHLIIKTEGEHKIVNPEDSYAQILYSFTHTPDETSIIRNLSRAQGGLIHFFARLDQEQGPLEFLGKEKMLAQKEWMLIQLEPHFVLAMVLSRRESLPLSRFEANLLIDLTKHPEEKAAGDLLRLLQKKQAQGLLRYADPTAEEMILSLLYPAQTAGEMLVRLGRYDGVGYPNTVTQRDSTELSADEIPPFKKEILDAYAFFTSRVLAALSYKKAGLTASMDLAHLEAEIPGSSSRKPWLGYAWLLCRAVEGDAHALGELWKYETGDLKLKSDIDVFDQACGLLLKAGRQVLLKLAPGYFTWGADTAELKNDTALGMAELSVPDPRVDGVTAHWGNPTELQETDDSDSRSHATMVFQTLLGNYTQTQDPTGHVWSYNFNESAPDLWAGIDALLTDILSDVETGAPLAVINMSFGFFGTDVRSHDLAKAFDSQTAESIRDKLAQLRQHKIPIVISAGNFNTPDNALQNLTAFNLFGMLDPSIIMVGSTRLGPQGDYEMSDFSSPGNFWVRSDVATLGEGYEFMTNKGVETDVMGTSFSAPQVARLIAKMKETAPNLSVEILQAILKMSSMDLSDRPETEGAGQIRPGEALYLAFVLGTRASKEERAKKAQELSVYNQITNLEQLAKWIRRQVFFQNTFRQSYGE